MSARLIIGVPCAARVSCDGWGGGVARMKWEENPADYIVVSTGKHSAEENSVIITMQN